MDLHDQLKNLFPDHLESEPEEIQEEDHVLFVQKEPMICKFENISAGNYLYERLVDLGLIKK